VERNALQNGSFVIEAKMHVMDVHRVSAGIKRCKNKKMHVMDVHRVSARIKRCKNTKMHVMDVHRVSAGIKRHGPGARFVFKGRSRT
jgi:hypothetical protein